MLIAVPQKITVIYYNFRHTFVPYAEYLVVVTAVVVVVDSHHVTSTPSSHWSTRRHPHSHRDLDLRRPPSRHR